jgi:hypothetical protein
MCQITLERLFDRILPAHTRKVASLFAQALSSEIKRGGSTLLKLFLSRLFIAVSRP